MTSIIKFTALQGALDEGPLAYHLQVRIVLFHHFIEVVFFHCPLNLILKPYHIYM